MTTIKIKPWISELPDYIPGKTIEEIKKQYNLKTVYKLASNENIFGPSPKVIKVIKDSLDELNYYPDSYNRDLREKFEKKTGIKRDCFIFGNGTDQIIEMVCDAILWKGKNIVIPDPTFLTYERSALKNNADIIKIPLKDFKQDVYAIVKAVNKNTGIVFLTSPHNPTGTILNTDEIKYVIENVDSKVLVVLDEAYIEFVKKEDRFDSYKFIGNYKNFMVMRTFSKIYGLAGLRIGYAVADKKVVKSIEKLIQPFVVNLVAQRAAAVSLDDDGYIEKNIELIIDEREKLFDFLEKNSIEYIKSQSNFVLIKTGSDTKKIVEELMENGYIVRDGEFLGFPLYIRVSISKPVINKKFRSIFLKLYNKYR